MKNFCAALLLLFASKAQILGQCTGVQWLNGRLVGDNAPTSCSSLADEILGAEYLKTDGTKYRKTAAPGTNTWEVVATSSLNTVPFTGSVAITATSATSVTGFQFPVVSGEKYAFWMTVNYTVPNSGIGSGWAISGPTLTSLSYNVRWPSSNATETLRSSSSYDDIIQNGGSVGATGNTAIIAGFIECSASGNAILRAQTETSGQAVTVVGGSIVYFKIN